MPSKYFIDSGFPWGGFSSFFHITLIWIDFHQLLKKKKALWRGDRALSYFRHYLINERVCILYAAWIEQIRQDRVMLNLMSCLAFLQLMLYYHNNKLALICCCYIYYWYLWVSPTQLRKMNPMNNHWKWGIELITFFKAASWALSYRYTYTD